MAKIGPGSLSHLIKYPKRDHLKQLGVVKQDSSRKEIQPGRMHGFNLTSSAKMWFIARRISCVTSDLGLSICVASCAMFTIIIINKV